MLINCENNYLAKNRIDLLLYGYHIYMYFIRYVLGQDVHTWRRSWNLISRCVRIRSKSVLLFFFVPSVNIHTSVGMNVQQYYRSYLCTINHLVITVIAIIPKNLTNPVWHKKNASHYNNRWYATISCLPAGHTTILYRKIMTIQHTTVDVINLLIFHTARTSWRRKRIILKQQLRDIIIRA